MYSPVVTSIMLSFSCSSSSIVSLRFSRMISRKRLRSAAENVLGPRSMSGTRAPGFLLTGAAGRVFAVFPFLPCGPRAMVFFFAAVLAAALAGFFAMS